MPEHLSNLMCEGFNVIEHQIEFMRTTLICGMYCGFGGRHSKYQPTMTHIYIRKFQNVAEKRASRFGILRIDDDVCTRNHGFVSVVSVIPIASKQSTRQPSFVSR